MASAPDEAKELRLVNNVEFKFAMAETDAQLNKLLNLYLPPLLLKLASPHEAVRNKVVSVCAHVNTRIRSSPLPLPLPALLDQFQTPSIEPLVQNFDLMYITMGIERIPVSERLDLLPRLITGISAHLNARHQRSLFNILLLLLPEFKAPARGSEEDIALRTKLGLSDADAQWLVSWLGKLMLLQSTVFAAGKAAPGLSPEDVALFSELDGLKSMPVSVLDKLKISAVKFLDTGAFTDNERFFPLLVAAEDGGAVSGVAESALKRCVSSVQVEDEKIVDELYTLLLGGRGVAAVKPKLQTRILGLLKKSRKAVELTRKDEIEKVVDLGLQTSFKRLRDAVFAYINWVCQVGHDDLTYCLGPGVVEKIRYWVVSDEGDKGDVKGQAYEVLALLACRCTHIVLEPQLDIIRFLFARVEAEKGAIPAQVETALGFLIRPLTKANLDGDVRSALESLLLDIVTRESRATSQAVKWAGRLLGFGNVIGRWIAILAIGMGGTIAEEGEKVLHPYYYRLNNPEPLFALNDESSAMDIDAETEDKYSFPALKDLVRYIFATQHTLPTSLQHSKLVDGRLPPKSFAAALAFVKRVAIWQGLGTQLAEIKIDQDWDRNVDAAIATDEKARAEVERFFADQLKSGDGTVETLLDESWYGMIFDGDGVENIRNTWNDLAVLVPSSVIERHVQFLPAVKGMLSAPKVETRRSAGFAIGLLASHSSADSAAITSLVEELISGADNEKSGPVLALGFLLSRLKQRGRLDVIQSEQITRSVIALEKILSNSRDSSLIEAAIEAFSELEVYTVFDAGVIDTAKMQSTFIEKAKRGDEKAVLALGYLSFIHPEDSKESEEILTELIKLGESGGVDRSFIIGEALSSYAAGWGSSSLRRGRHIAGLEWTGGRRNGVKKLLDQLLTRAAEPGGGGKRRLTIVGLLSIFELCSEDKSIQERLGQAQQVFRSFLTDRDEFIQETAARGLTAVYGLSDEETRQELVRTLVSSFTGETREKLSVNRDTQLFEPGAMPTGDGKSVGSYGDIMSLASELGDPSLVYKFMTLARHNSVWSSRAAFGRFGLGNILSSSEEVKNNRKLWPVLYRYRFDPSPGVRQSMDSIWSALGGGVDTVERWWRDIVAECLRGALNGREWRVREASVGALTELLGGRKVSQYKDLVEEIWKIAFKVLDDVKESVRVAAMKLCRILTAGMVRAVEGDTGPKEKAEILGTLMGFLVGKQGLEAEAKDVQMFALTTLLKVVKSAGEALRPWIPELVDKMLLILSDLEPEAVNYLIMNADKYNTTGEDIDRVRLSSVRSSPIMSTIEDILDNIDADSTARLVPQLVKSMRTSLGLPSKVGCSRVVVSLVLRKPHLFKPYADDVLKALLAAVKDRSEVVSRSYAVAIGYLCRIANEKGITQVVNWSQQSYWQGEERDRLIAGSVIGAVYKNATDNANSMAVDFLPFVFVAKNDTDKDVAKEFSLTWDENTGGSGAIKLYLKEIIQLAIANISSARWSAKQTSAFALADAATAIATDITAVQMEALWPAMVTGVSGKSWNGKEKVLEAFVLLATKGKQCFENDEQKILELKKIVLREAKRNNLTYRGPALQSLATFADGFEKVDMFDEVYDIVAAAIEPIDEDDMDVDVADGKSVKQAQHQILVNGLKAVSCALQPQTSNARESLERSTKVLDMFDAHVIGGDLALKGCSIEGTELFLTRVSTTEGLLSGSEWGDALRRAWKRVCEHLADKNFLSGRIKAVAALQPFGKAMEQYKMSTLGKEQYQDLADKVSKDIKDAREREKAPMVLQVLEPAAAALLRIL